MSDIFELQYKLMEARGEVSTNNNKIIARTAKLDDANKLLKRGYFSKFL